MMATSLTRPLLRLVMANDFIMNNANDVCAAAFVVRSFYYWPTNGNLVICLSCAIFMIYSSWSRCNCNCHCLELLSHWQNSFDANFRFGAETLDSCCQLNQTFTLPISSRWTPCLVATASNVALIRHKLKVFSPLRLLANLQICKFEFGNVLAKFPTGYTCCAAEATVNCLIILTKAMQWLDFSWGSPNVAKWNSTYRAQLTARIYG